MIAVGRCVFIKWMKSKGFWGSYKYYFMYPKENMRTFYEQYYQNAWIHPESIRDFLGQTSFDYDNAYKPWTEYCINELERQIGGKIKEYESGGYR